MITLGSELWWKWRADGNLNKRDVTRRLPTHHWCRNNKAWRMLIEGFMKVMSFTLAATWSRRGPCRNCLDMGMSLRRSGRCGACCSLSFRGCRWNWLTQKCRYNKEVAAKEVGRWECTLQSIPRWLAAVVVLSQAKTWEGWSDLCIAWFGYQRRALLFNFGLRKGVNLERAGALQLWQLWRRGEYSLWIELPFHHMKLGSLAATWQEKIAGQ